MMSEVFSFLFGGAVFGLVLHAATYSSVEGSWKTDCEKLGAHVSASDPNKVYKCELRK
jgi:hypothetical protein